MSTITWLPLSLRLPSSLASLGVLRGSSVSAIMGTVVTISGVERLPFLERDMDVTSPALSM